MPVAAFVLIIVACSTAAAPKFPAERSCGKTVASIPFETARACQAARNNIATATNLLAACYPTK